MSHSYHLFLWEEHLRSALLALPFCFSSHTITSILYKVYLAPHFWIEVFIVLVDMDIRKNLGKKPERLGECHSKCK